MTTNTAVTCTCTQHTDGTATTFLCPLHAADDPCHTKSLVTGKRRRGSIRNGRCSHCQWEAGQ
jgi:hypothetical protein